MSDDAIDKLAGVLKSDFESRKGAGSEKQSVLFLVLNDLSTRCRGRKPKYASLSNEIRDIALTFGLVIDRDTHDANLQIQKLINEAKGGDSPLFTRTVLRYYADSFPEHLAELLKPIRSQHRLIDIFLRQLLISNRVDAIVTPHQRSNFVYIPDNNKDSPNGLFSFGISLRVTCLSTNFTILEFDARYSAPDGCECLNSEFHVEIDGVEQAFSPDYPVLTAPVRVNGSTANILCRRKVWPPIMAQTPTECDQGYVTIRLLLADKEERFKTLFRFAPGGDLTPVDRLPEVPILSDTELTIMLDRNRITEHEFRRASRYRAVDRYRLVRFPARKRSIDLAEGGVSTPDAREIAFLSELARRRLLD